jgi:hypothetical protein
MTRIALIHALSHSVAPINEAFARDWPEAVRMNLLDDSLSADLARDGKGLDDAMHERFQRLAQYAVDTGARHPVHLLGLRAVHRGGGARHAGIAVLKPNEAMIEEAEGQGRGRAGSGLIATFAPTLASMPPEFPRGTPLELALAEGALDALNAGDTQRHDALIAAQAAALRERGCTRIALAQFSMARARAACEAGQRIAGAHHGRQRRARAAPPHGSQPWRLGRACALDDREQRRDRDLRRVAAPQRARRRVSRSVACRPWDRRR